MDVRNGQTEPLRLPQFRVTLNARCGRSCFFCRPSGEAVSTASRSELSVDDLIAVATRVRAAGIDSIKLTGGDPALYKPLEQAVHRLRAEAGFTEIEVISRHPRIGERADELAALGVTQFNMSIDTLDPELHSELCGVDDLPQVLEALHRCAGTGVPVKVNTVVMGGINDTEVPELAQYCSDAGVTTLKLLDVIKDLDAGAESFARRLAIKRSKTLRELYMPLETFAEQFAADAVTTAIVGQGGLGHPMTTITLPSGLQVMLKDSKAGAWYGSVCDRCPFYPCHDALMALRLTADLRLQFCLLREDNTIDLSGIIADPERLGSAIGDALAPYTTATFRAPVRVGLEVRP
ncbi:radical SAM protein [Nocardia neocaledoniensis]|uniref:radical SAM protein n=1 Tax=Nocardia neocaledoniensis TaxID=236511 RepID=UPI002454FBFA|nr:radical SAM protein [Nocardia neocaledoniensis]